MISPLVAQREANFGTISEQDLERVLSIVKKVSNFVVSRGVMLSALHI